MNKRLLSAAAAVALCAFAAPANARSYDHVWDWSYNTHDTHAYDDDDSEATPRRQRRLRAARPRSQGSRRVATQPVPTQQPVAALPQHATKPEARPAAPPQKLAAANPLEASKLDLPDTKPLVPFFEPRQPKHAARDGRNCLKPAARTLLERIEAEFGPMQIISTCRPGARIAGSGRISKHATGEAIDFNAGKRKGEVVRWLIANHKTGGTMTYAGMSHVHVDVGRHFVALNSGGGSRRR
jgi:hypothetical protein